MRNILDFLTAQQQPQQPMGMTEQILSQRFEPTPMDVGNAALAGIGKNQYVDPQSLADNRMNDALTKLALLAKMQGGSEAPSNVREYQYYSALPRDQQQEFLRVKRAQQNLNLGGSFGVVDPLTGGIGQEIPKTLPPQDEPAIREAQAAASERGASNAKSDFAANNTLPVIQQLRNFNQGTFHMPYADTPPVRAYSRIFGSSEQQAMQTNMDLLKQARTDLAAPLAKELGVNPTDRDFQATLDRIFDSNASQSSREAQINALEQRILERRAIRTGTAPPAQSLDNGWQIEEVE